MTTAADLPVGSIVADADTAFLKVEHVPGKRVWCATSLASHYDDEIVDAYLNHYPHALLREGPGTDG